MSNQLTSILYIRGADGLMHGVPAINGISPQVSIQNTAGSHQVTIKDSTGDHVFIINDGHTPQKGTDYWTTQDRQQIVDDAVAALTTWDGGGSY